MLSALPLSGKIYRDQQYEQQTDEGTFANPPDGGSLTIGSNTFQANYSGGDGNDLTLTVVQ